jgi:hypothetical protein
MKTVNIIAILASPLIAVLVSMWIQHRKEKRLMQKSIFSTLWATRHQVTSTEEIVRALNMIDVVFSSKKKVRKLWREYYEMLNNSGLNNPTGWEQWKAKRHELITEMAKAVGYRKEITLMDVERIYSPVGLLEESMTTRAIGDELLRVLKESKGLQVVPKDEGGEASAPLVEKK